ncbi:T-complex protein 11-domain-containing protein [Phascolomyces articulosus]|uniref:T-complex protein 11-domain-containing protein n=1 Tax=Phascolomyces articulosus TaxID=60185 RepID=A0AAD5KB03_9FUNG|nr:T-complex protein 11-domain-containing protein [Phascolomyces articulosus]
MEKTGSGFYIIDAFSLRQTSRKPFHLEKRFLRNTSLNSSSQNSTTSLEEAGVKREALLEARREKLNRRFLAVQKAVKEVEARKESQRLLFWESLQVAELKRNHRIEQRRAASKELVERAKIVARQNILRYEAEQERLRDALENRLKQSHARRLHMLNQPKSRILITGTTTAARATANTNRRTKKRKQQDSMNKHHQREQEQYQHHVQQGQEELHVQEATKVKKRKASWSALLSAFRKLGLPLVSMPETWLQFNHLGRLLRNKRVIHVTSKILNMLLNVIDKDSRRRSRVLLSAYMMTMCPREVFQTMHGSEEQQLLASAKRVLQLFEEIVHSQGGQPNSATKLAFEQCWNGYYALFQSWKSNDMTQLVANMSAYCIELMRLKKTLGKQGEEDGINDQLNQQILQVKDRIRGIGGAPALEQLNESEAALSQSSEVAATTRIASPGPSSVPPSPTPRPERSSTHEEPPSISTEQLNRLLGGYAPVSGITNQQLAHEIIIDPNFKLQRPTVDEKPKTLEQHVQKIATQAFFDAVEDDISNGRSENSLPGLMGDIRQRLLGLVRSGSSLHIQISEAIDISLIEQETKQKVFDLERKLQYVLHVMRQICAPVRDEAIEKIGEMDNNIHQLRAILEMLDDMALDLGNFRLRSLRPHLIPVAVEYEQSKFAESLAKGKVGLAKARSWLQTAKKRLIDVANERNPEDVPSSSPSTNAIFEEGFISLLTSPEIISASWCPETMLLDVERITRYQNEMQSITIVAALVMLARNFGHVDNINEFSAKLFIMLEDDATTIDNLSLEIERNVRMIDEQRRSMIRAMVDKTVSHSDTVYSLLMRRVASVVRTQLNSGKFATREVLASYGLECVRKSLEQLCERVMVLGRHHFLVYSRWYDEILIDDN